MPCVEAISCCLVGPGYKATNCGALGSPRATNYCFYPESCSVWDLCAPFKNGVYFPQPSGSPKSKPHWPSKPNVLGAHLPGAGPPPPGWGAWWGLKTPHSLRRTSAIVIILPFVGLPPRGVGLDYTVSLPLLPVSLWFLLYIFCCRKSFFFARFQSFSSIVAL